MADDKSEKKLKHAAFAKGRKSFIRTGNGSGPRQKIAVLTDGTKKVMELAAQGYRNAEIAEILGVCRQTVSHHFILAAEANKEKIADYAGKILRHDLEVTQQLLYEWMPAALRCGKDGEDIKADEALKAADFILRVLDRRAKYLGLDAPVKTQSEVTQTNVPASPEALEAAIRAKLEGLKRAAIESQPQVIEDNNGADDGATDGG